MIEGLIADGNESTIKSAKIIKLKDDGVWILDMKIFDSPILRLHCKNSFSTNSNYKESQDTVWNKDDLDSVIKTKTSILALKSYLNILYSGRYGNLLYSANYF